VKRASAYLTGVFGFGAMLLLAADTRAQGPGGGAPAPGGNPPPAATGRPTIAVFNMAAVMRDYGKAQYQVYELNAERAALSADLVKWRGEYIKLQQEAQVQQVPAIKEKMTRDMLDLAHRIEVKDREVTKILNEKATAIISQLYDDIKLVVDKTAEMNGYHIVFAYPDAVTPEEMKKAEIKELKLKPPAAQPFYVAKQVDVTGVVVQTLNAWYPSKPVPKETPGLPPGTPGLPKQP
jgi:Skp family chaperone for outer membrane proteins